MPYNGYIDVPDMNLDPSAINMTDPGYQAYRKAVAADAAAVPADPSADVAGGNMDNTTPPPGAPTTSSTPGSRMAAGTMADYDTANPAPVKQAITQQLAAAPSDQSQNPDAGLPNVDAGMKQQVAAQLAAPPGGPKPAGPVANSLPDGVNFQYQPRMDGSLPGPNGVVTTIGGSGDAADAARTNPQTAGIYQKVASDWASGKQPHVNWAIGPAGAVASAPTLNIPRQAWDSAVAGNTQTLNNQHELDMLNAKGKNDLAALHEQYVVPIQTQNDAAAAKREWDVAHGGPGSPEALGAQKQYTEADLARLNAQTESYKTTLKQATTPDMQQNADTINTMLTSLQKRGTPQANQLQAQIIGSGDPRKANPAAFTQAFQDAMKPTSDEYLSSGPGKDAFDKFSAWLNAHQEQYRDSDRDATHGMINNMVADAGRAGVSVSEQQRLQARLIQADMDTVAKRPWSQNWGFGIQRGAYNGPNQPQQLAPPGQFTGNTFLPPSRQEAYPGANDAASLFGWNQ